MIALSSLFVGVLLVLLLSGIAVKGWLATREEPGNGEDDQEACPAEFVSKIFSPEDWTYLHGLKSPALEKLFREERKAVALVWVRQTSSAIRCIMREHVTAARRSGNLEPATELKIFLVFAALLITCTALRMGIHLAGPARVAGLAGYAQTLVRQITEAERNFEFAIRERKADAANSP